MPRGDHIYVSRGIYTHHGIDAGDGTVIHFTGEPGAKRNATIARSSMTDFLQEAECKVRRYGKRDDADTTMARAESQIGATGYHLVINNCEHFAAWCCTGRRVSRQALSATSLAAHGAVAGTTVVATTSVLGAIGAVAGLSGAGIMSALGSAGGLVGGGAAAGPAVLGALPAVASVGVTHRLLRDDESLAEEDRQARRDGRVASIAGASASTVGGVAVISAAGTTGLSAAGITSGLAAIGATVSGGMAAGTTIVVAVPAVAAASIGLGVFLASKRLRKSPRA